MGFSDYFLVCWTSSITPPAKNKVGPGRGTLPVVASPTALRIVDLDPIRYDLLFERFLNPGETMPIDMDFDERYRAR